MGEILSEGFVRDLHPTPRRRGPWRCRQSAGLVIKRSWVRVSAGHAAYKLWACFSHLCSSVIKQYSLSWYRPKGGDVLRLRSKGRYGSCVVGRQNCVIHLLHTGHI